MPTYVEGADWLGTKQQDTLKALSAYLLWLLPDCRLLWVLPEARSEKQQEQLSPGLRKLIRALKNLPERPKDFSSPAGNHPASNLKCVSSSLL